MHCSASFILHGIENFQRLFIVIRSYNSYLKIKKSLTYDIILIVKVSHGNRKCAAVLNIYHRRKDWSSSVGFFSYLLRMIRTGDVSLYGN